MKDALGHGSNPHSAGVENVGRLANELEAHSNKWAEAGVRNRVYESRGDIHLDDLVVPKDQRNQGVGNQYVRELTEIADRYGKRLTLTPAQRNDFHGTTSTARLQRFYGGHGFVRNKGRNVDFTLSDTMYRNPK